MFRLRFLLLSMVEINRVCTITKKTTSNLEIRLMKLKVVTKRCLSILMTDFRIQALSNKPLRCMLN
jgi:hypothetical protein